jgi:hypothetical protein
MANTELLIRLRDLHEELSAINDDMKYADAVDNETIDALGQLVTDVGGLVDQAKTVTEDEGVDDVSERHEVLDRVMKFESRHPRVVNFLSQVTDLLAMMGI